MRRAARKYARCRVETDCFPAGDGRDARSPLLYRPYTFADSPVASDLVLRNPSILGE